MDTLTNSSFWDRQRPAKLEDIEALCIHSGLDLPSAYLTFLQWSDGGEGELGIDPGWLQLWSTQEVLQYNHHYEVQQWLPGFWAFGTNGGGELLAFDTRTPHPWRIFMIPFIPMVEEEAILVTKDFATFAQAIGQLMDDTEAGGNG